MIKYEKPTVFKILENHLRTLKKCLLTFIHKKVTSSDAVLLTVCIDATLGICFIL
jgi:hypothetical protein